MKKKTIYLTGESVSAIKTQAKVLGCPEAGLIRSVLEKEFVMHIKDFVPNFDLVTELDIALPDWDLSNLDVEMQGFGQ
ncbi:MAG: hypothetical protein NTW81_06755 [Actinobacteria bacterium]|nr:hypothetical protein [Actinomycetota bacterium]